MHGISVDFLWVERLEKKKYFVSCHLRYLTPENAERNSSGYVRHQGPSLHGISAWEIACRGRREGRERKEERFFSSPFSVGSGLQGFFFLSCLNVFSAVFWFCFMRQSWGPWPCYFGPSIGRDSNLSRFCLLPFGDTRICPVCFGRAPLPCFEVCQDRLFTRGGQADR